MPNPAENSRVSDPLERQVDELFARADQRAHAFLAGMLAMVRLGDEIFPTSRVSAELATLARADSLIGYRGKGRQEFFDEAAARRREVELVARDRPSAQEIVKALQEDLGEGRTGGASVAGNVGRLTLGPFVPEAEPVPPGGGTTNGNESKGGANGFAVYVDGALPLAPIPVR